jgi:hypothetical protein
VVLHHGKIDVHSREEKGTEFVIQLLLGHEHLKPDEIAASSETVPDEKRAGAIEAFYMIEEGVDREAGEEGDEIERIMWM